MHTKTIATISIVPVQRSGYLKTLRSATLLVKNSSGVPTSIFAKLVNGCVSTNECIKINNFAFESSANVCICK